MKRLIITLFFLIPLTVAAQTDLYERYAKREGVKVASVSNFAIDSNSKVDVTLIEAEDEEGWKWMKKEFRIGELTKNQEINLSHGSDVVLFEQRNRSHPSENAPINDEKIDIANSCYMGISYLGRTVFLFCVGSEEQSDAIVALLVKKMIHSH